MLWRSMPRAAAALSLLTGSAYALARQQQQFANAVAELEDLVVHALARGDGRGVFAEREFSGGDLWNYERAAEFWKAGMADR